MSIVTRNIRKIRKKRKVSKIISSNQGISIGDNLNYNGNLSITCAPGANLTIGKNVSIDRDCEIDVYDSIVIGSGCTIESSVFISDVRTNDSGDKNKAGIFIGDNCWIGENVRIERGAHVGDGTVIAADCTINGTFPNNTIVRKNSDQVMPSSEPVVSIIMPVYNSERYVTKAIQSVLKQTYTDFELLIVDDGSTDGSGKICDDFSELDERIIVIHKVNGGVCSARNLGISKSRGKYITFIDNDDLYKETFLELLVDGIIKYDADLIKSARRNVKVDENLEVLTETIYQYPTNAMLNQKEFQEKYYAIRTSGIYSSVWNGIYKKSVILDNGIAFDEDVRHGNEDCIFNSEFTLKCNRIVILSDILYIHFYRAGHSTSMKFYPDVISTRLNSILLELKIIDGDEKQKRLITLEGIRDCFRALVFLNSKKERAPYIDEIKNNLDFGVLKNYPVLKSKEISNIAKIDLFLIKHEWYGVYCSLRRLRLNVQ